MRQITFTDRLRYQFDNLMAKGTIVLIGWLFTISAMLIILFSLFVFIVNIGPSQEDGSPLGFSNIAWMILMRTIDAGTMGGDVGNWSFLFTMLLVTIAGIFSVSILIGVLTSGIESKLDDLRKGRSFVAEEGHTVILGWSSQIFTIISELVEANANQRGDCIAILAEQDKVEMEDEIRVKVGPTGRTRIVCRTGSPLDLTDLEIINPHSARSIIILAPENTPNPDSHIIKTTLALVNHPHRRQTPYHIVCELHDPKNLEAVHAAGGHEVETVLGSDLISRMTVQTCRQSGLSVIYIELLDFGGDEIYFHHEPELIGKSFSEALFAYEDSALIGLYSKEKGVRLLPPFETRLEAGDQVIAISADDDTIRLSNLTPQINAEAIRVAPKREQPPERTLILGWNQRALIIIRELDQYVTAGSDVLVAANISPGEAEAAVERLQLNHLAVSFLSCDTTNRHILEELNIAAYDHVIVLSYSDTLDPQEADAQTLITLLHLRGIAERNNQSFSIVSEMLDVRNRELAEVTRADDFIVSDKLVSLVLAQISENKNLGPVFADLFDPEGAELYLKPAEDYVTLGQSLNFYTVVEAARQRGEIAIGYRQQALANNANQAYGVNVNPAKSTPITFFQGDRIITLAES